MCPGLKSILYRSPQFACLHGEDLETCTSRFDSATSSPAVPAAAAAEPLHGQERQPGGLLDVEDADDVRVREVAGDFGLVEEPLAGPGIGQQVGQEDLEGDLFLAERGRRWRRPGPCRRSRGGHVRRSVQPGPCRGQRPVQRYPPAPSALEVGRSRCWVWVKGPSGGAAAVAGPRTPVAIGARAGRSSCFVSERGL